jgi:DNA polymerase elongation subunit (family B)
MNIIYDLEVYANVFTLAAADADSPFTWQFEISPWRNDSKAIMDFCRWIKKADGRMIGFNNIGFDYPLLHLLVQAQGAATPQMLYDKAQAIIGSMDGDNRWVHTVYTKDRFVEQLDLYRIHHFDNRARSTSLKALEFNMRMDNISDLPFPVGSFLNQEQIEVLKEYNAHDVLATKRFYFETLPMIEFREGLTKTHKRDFMNHADVKIGKEIFQMELEKVGVDCYKYGPNGREPKQTKRDQIRLIECIPNWIRFYNSEFDRVQQWFKQQVVTETKGVFKDVVAKVGGLDFVFGTGGLHASVENRMYEADSEYMILDVDVTSLYPSIAIEHNHYPEHLGSKFVDVYRALRKQRVSFKKGTVQNAALKLALNGVYGASNDPYSVFYDPLFTMKITLGGQMMIAMLAEWLLTVGLDIIQVNTDGITLYVPRCQAGNVKAMCTKWEKLTKLSLEYVEYSKMAIADVNSYIAVGTDGSVKRKGRYEYDLEWHQNASALVVAKVAEKVLVEGVSVMDTLMNWSDRMDFFLRVKVPRTSHLLWGDERVQNTCRYYVSTGGQALTKVMPPLPKKPDHWRRIGVESGWTVCVCNDIADALLPINYAYYVEEIEKLTLRMK